MYLPIQPRGTDSGTCPSGIIAGAVLGSIAGTLLVLWLIYTLRAGLNPTSNTKNTSEVVNRPRSHHSHRSSRSRSARRSSRTIYVDEKGNRVPPPPRAYYKS
ncbi:hypothetical protein NA56DRAFT_649926 [Hyaloscypha hepaticicola]|uniref:Uncharacterized protein n=1 Tax=Hyaloscypha hepaticicola TaxID=2082293 RepID=A0A2J6PPD5_9HELO|nr:hypothetical protein NA56DRAFT_649926 [Hyaloscypha hepaticicola]